jgi:NAD(P)H-dependent nitrite reductase small subunit
LSRFIKVAKLNTIPNVKGKKVKVKGRYIALFKYKNKIYAINNSCPHQGADLSDGHIKESNVVCPLHNWQFDLKTGAFSGNENIRIPTYKTKVEDNDVFILWENK